MAIWAESGEQGPGPSRAWPQHAIGQRNTMYPLSHAHTDPFLDPTDHLAAGRKRACRGRLRSRIVRRGDRFPCMRKGNNTHY